MYGYKSFLKLGDVSSILNKDGFELMSFSYSFEQSVDECGKPQGEVMAGSINMTFANLPTTDMLEWMINPRKFKTGMITTYDSHDEPLLKISFSKANCVDMRFEYNEMGKGYCTTSLTIVAKHMSVGDSSIDNDWQNI